MALAALAKLPSLMFLVCVWDDLPKDAAISPTVLVAFRKAKPAAKRFDSFFDLTKLFKPAVVGKGSVKSVPDHAKWRKQRLECESPPPLSVSRCVSRCVSRSLQSESELNKIPLSVRACSIQDTNISGWNIGKNQTIQV